MNSVLNYSCILINRNGFIFIYLNNFKKGLWCPNTLCYFHHFEFEYNLLGTLLAIYWWPFNVVSISSMVSGVWIAFQSFWFEWWNINQYKHTSHFCRHFRSVSNPSPWTINSMPVDPARKQSFIVMECIPHTYALHDRYSKVSLSCIHIIVNFLVSRNSARTSERWGRIDSSELCNKAWWTQIPNWIETTLLSIQ